MALSGSYDFTQWKRFIKAPCGSVEQLRLRRNRKQAELGKDFPLISYTCQILAVSAVFLGLRHGFQKPYASSEVTGPTAISIADQGAYIAAANKPVTGADYTSYWTQLGNTGGAWAPHSIYQYRGIYSCRWSSGYPECLYRDTSNRDYPERCRVWIWINTE